MMDAEGAATPSHRKSPPPEASGAGLSPGGVDVTRCTAGSSIRHEAECGQHQQHPGNRDTHLGPPAVWLLLWATLSAPRSGLCFSVTNGRLVFRAWKAAIEKAGISYLSFQLSPRIRNSDALCGRRSGYDSQARRLEKRSARL